MMRRLVSCNEPAVWVSLQIGHQKHQARGGVTACLPFHRLLQQIMLGKYSCVYSTGSFEHGDWRVVLYHQ